MGSACHRYQQESASDCGQAAVTTSERHGPPQLRSREHFTAVAKVKQGSRFRNSPFPCCSCIRYESLNYRMQGQRGMQHGMPQRICHRKSLLLPTWPVHSGKVGAAAGSWATGTQPHPQPALAAQLSSFVLNRLEGLDILP